MEYLQGIACQLTAGLIREKTKFMLRYWNKSGGRWREFGEGNANLDYNEYIFLDIRHVSAINLCWISGMFLLEICVGYQACFC